MGVAEDVADVQGSRDRGRGGVDGVDLVARGRAVEAVDPLVVPALQPGLLEAVDGGLFGHGAGMEVVGHGVASLGQVSRCSLSSRRVAVVAATGPSRSLYSCCASTTPSTARSATSRRATPVASRCTCAARPSTTCPTSATAASPWSGTWRGDGSPFADSTCASSRTSPTSTTTSSAGPCVKGPPSPRWPRTLRGRVVGGHGGHRRGASRRRPPRHAVRAQMVTLIEYVPRDDVAYVIE